MTSLPIEQLFVFGFDGLRPCKLTKELLAKNACGVTLFAKNIESLEQVVELNSELIDCGSREFPAFISVDQEGGRVARLRDICTNLPPMRTLGLEAVDNTDLLYRVGAMVARELTALGFHMDFAPCVDIDHCHDKAIIGDRSFSQYAEVVANSAEQFIAGMQDAGLAACAKHFPGHGGTIVDSHFDLPQLSRNKKSLVQHELVPFKKAIEGHVAGIMTAHIMLSQIDDTYPSTMSKTILTGLLRKHLGYQGTVFSDDLNMKAIADRYDLKEIIQHGIHAGIDIFLICAHPEKTMEAIDLTKSLLSEGKISEKQVTDALKRIKSLKDKYIGTPSVPNKEDAKQIVRCKPHLELVASWN